MARLQYFVVYHQKEWKITFEQKHNGPYSTQAEAIRKAIDAAHSSGQKGMDAQILVQGTDNQFRAEWTYSHDPYPPKG